jgi:flagellar hook-associated protein 3 FlgL
MNRVTSQLQIDVLKQSIQSNQREVFRVQQAIASGKKLTLPSENPSGMREVTGIRSFLDITETRQKTIDLGMSRLQLTEDTVGKTTDLIQRARELVLVARNDTTNAADRILITEEVQQVLAGLVDLANTKIDGRFIFSGHETQTAAYALNAVSASADAPTLTVNDNNTGATTTSVAIQTGSALTGQEYSIEFTSPINFNVINTTTGATTLSNQTYTSGGNIDFDGLRVVLTDNPTGPLGGDQFTISAHNSSDATVSASVSTQSALQSHIFEIRFTSSTTYDLVDLTADQVLSTGNAYTSGGNIVFSGITAVVTDGTVTPQSGDVFRVRADYAYQGDTGAIAVEVGDGKTVTTNTVGSQVFSGPDVDLFDTLQDLNEALFTNNTVPLSAILANLDLGIDQLTESTADVGGRASRLETFKDSIELVSLNLQSRKSFLEDTDLAEAGAELAQLETNLNASLLVLERQFRISLLNFIS